MQLKMQLKMQLNRKLRPTVPHHWDSLIFGIGTAAIHHFFHAIRSNNFLPRDAGSLTTTCKTNIFQHLTTLFDFVFMVSSMFPMSSRADVVNHTHDLTVVGDTTAVEFKLSP